MTRAFNITVFYLAFLLGADVLGQASPQPPVSDSSSSNDNMLEELNSARTLLSALDLSEDRTDPILLEALEQLADRLIALNQFDEAHSVLDRAVQISRVSEGLYASSQIPLLKKKIDNYANRGEWKKVRDQGEHLRWLYTDKTPINAALVRNLLDLGDVHLRGVAEDEPAQQTHHLRRSLETNRLALVVAEAVWGENDPRIAPVTYQLLKQFHLQMAAIERGGRTGYELRELVPGSRWVQDRDTARRAHYYVGMNLLDGIRNIYANAQPPDLEGMAMSDLYTADWQVLFTRRDEALSTYHQAYLGLKSAGIDQQVIDGYLAQPEVLPVAEFHSSIAKATEARVVSQPQFVAAELDEFSSSLSYSEWTPGFPDVRKPAEFDTAYEPKMGFALFSFNLYGLVEVTRWINGRYRSGIGVIQEAQLLDTQLDLPIGEDGLLKKLDTLRFRPSMVNGAPQQASGTLKYLIAY